MCTRRMPPRRRAAPCERLIDRPYLDPRLSTRTPMADAGTWTTTPGWKDSFLTTLATTSPLTLPPLVPVARAAEMIGISRSTGYELARTGQLPGVTRLGARFVVRTAVLSRWLDGQPDAP